MKAFYFENIEFLFLLLSLIPIFYFFKKTKKIKALPFSSLFVSSQLKLPSLRVHFISFPFYLKMISIILMIFALARPRSSHERSTYHLKGIHIMFALDISQSMAIEDMSGESRLEAAKQVMKEFVQKRMSDKIGFIVFSGESYTKTPLSLDYEVLLDRLKTTSIDLDIEQGTAIGLALSHGVARLKDTSSKTKILILLTDGDNNAGEVSPETALEIAKDYKVKVYSIGLGKNGIAQVPIYIKDQFGKTRRVYQRMKSFVNVKLLQKISSETKGKFFRVTDKLELESVFKEIDQLEKSEIKGKDYLEHKEYFHYLLILSFFFLLLSYFLSQSVLKVKP